MSRLPLDQVDAFVTAARLRNLTRAAEAMHLTVSALSHRMRLLEQRLGDLQQHRVLVLWGDKDRVFDRSGLQPLQKLLPQAQLEALPGIGHLPMMEAPADTAHKYARFLDPTKPDHH